MQLSATRIALATSVFDVREVMHQIDESRTGVATLAALTTAQHLLTALVAAGVLLVERRTIEVRHTN